jgi:hypothetical protein
MELLESEIVKQIVEWCNAKGMLVLRMQGQGTMRTVNGKRIVTPSPVPGIPDFLIITPSGRHVWVEAKTRKGVVSDIQKKFHIKLKKFNCYAHIARSLQDVINIFNNLEPL